MEEKMEKLKKFSVILLIIIMSGFIFFYQTKKIGFHEDEGYTLCSSVNPNNGLMSAYDTEKDPVWRTKDYVKNFMSLTPNNILNFKALYLNQAYDNHPPVFYTLVHFSSILFGGQFSKYTVFVVNIIAFILSCFVLQKILKILNKENLTFGVLILYGLSMGTISMVIFQRMYMLLTFFILLYFYAVYAFFIFAIMIIEMIHQKKDKKIIKDYIICHVIYGVLGILIFVPCIKHLIFSDRGLTNLGNAGYLAHLFTYLKHLAYAFTINNNSSVLMLTVLAIFVAGLIYTCIKSKEKFVIFVTFIPSIFYFLINVKMTSFQELRYIMAVIPFVVLTLFFILDNLIKCKYNSIIFAIISILLVTNGMIYSKPKFLYENYQNCLDIANENSEKSFVYVYDNFFNHMQSIPEMMIYEKTLIFNYNNDELRCIVDDENLNNEGSFVLSIKAYMDNDKILNEIKDNSDFKNITLLYEGGNEDGVVNNNYYLVSK